MEEFYSIQGEGYNTGRPAYFIRLGGCDVGCHWCDVKESWDAEAHPVTNIVQMIENAKRSLAPAAVITGGEPAMYDLEQLTYELRRNNIRAWLETSGAYKITGQWDWICLSPKKNVLPLMENYSKANELKMIIYNKNDFRFAEKCSELFPASGFRYLQPEWSRREEMLPLIVERVKQDPKWKISLQTHKYIGVP